MKLRMDVKAGENAIHETANLQRGYQLFSMQTQYAASTVLDSVSWFPQLPYFVVDVLQLCSTEAYSNRMKRLCVLLLFVLVVYGTSDLQTDYYPGNNQCMLPSTLRGQCPLDPLSYLLGCKTGMSDLLDLSFSGKTFFRPLITSVISYTPDSTSH